MSKLDFAKWVLTVPAIASWVNYLVNWSEVWKTIWDVVTATNTVMETWNSMLNPLFAGATWVASTLAWFASAWLLTNEILKDFWVESKTKRYAASWIAAGAAFIWWTAAAPYLAAWATSYFVWKYGWKLWKEAIKRTSWIAWGLTWWLVKSAAVWTYNSVKAWIKWEQKLNPII